MRIDRLEPIQGLHDVYDIEVEVDHSFIVEGCVLHNSQVCKYQDGRQYFYRDGRNQPKPPFHHGGCRSTTSPILSPEYDFTREARKRPAVTEVDGKAKAEQVSGSTTYYSWLNRQNAAVQDKALGVIQGKVFRNAGLSPEEFKKATVNSLGQPLSLKDMERNNNKIADYLAKQ